MAVGDDATAAGYPILTGSEQANTLDTEVNRTRDFVAQVKALILATWPVNRGGTGSTSKSGARTNLGITSGTANPSGGADGDIYFKIV